MPTEPVSASRRCQCPGLIYVRWPVFQVTTIGRFWVTAEGDPGARRPRGQHRHDDGQRKVGLRALRGFGGIRTRADPGTDPRWIGLCTSQGQEGRAPSRAEQSAGAASSGSDGAARHEGQRAMPGARRNQGDDLPLRSARWFLEKPRATGPSSLLLIRLLQLGTISWGQAAVGCRTHGSLLKQADKHELARRSQERPLTCDFAPLLSEPLLPLAWRPHPRPEECGFNLLRSSNS